MADLSKLRRGAGKGAPPKATNTNLKERPREATAEAGKTMMQFSVPEDIAERFSMEAGRRFGFKKGSKSKMFLAMFQEYRDRQAE